MRVTINVTAGPAEGRSFTFEQPDCFLFGRAADAGVSLPFDKYFSRHHFLLQIAPPRCKVTDLDSSNGTHVNGIRYGGKTATPDGVPQAPGGVKETYLKDGDEITVGSTRLQIAIEGPGAAPEDETKLLPHPGAGAELEETVHRTSLLQGAPAIPGYTIEAELGRGGMGAVYKAVQQSSGRVVAIKTLLPNMAATPERVRTFEREVELTRQLKHPNIVELLEHGRCRHAAGGGFYCVLEFVDGTDLAKFIKAAGKPLSLPEAAPLMLGALAGLAYAHGATIRTRLANGNMRLFKGVVHRDLKPPNILLARANNGWTPKVADFGLSKSFESAGMTDMTMPGQLAGTPTYWPREQITHYKYLYPATDVFSIAAVFYKMLAGAWVRDGFEEMFSQCRRSSRSAGISDYLRVICSAGPRPIQQRNPDIPAPVAAVIDRALRETEVAADETKMRAALADLRYPDAGAFKAALSSALQAAGITV